MFAACCSSETVQRQCPALAGVEVSIFFIRGGVTLTVTLMKTSWGSDVTGSFLGFPPGANTDLVRDQDPIGATFEAWIQFRDKIKWCKVCVSHIN
jgi:hypothetical protein